MAFVHFLTFGDRSPELRGAAARLARQAARTGLFKSISCCSLATIIRDYPQFWRQHGQFLLTHARGFGYWLWKPFLIAAKLDEIAEGDFLIYADAGCEFVADMQAEILDLLPSEADFDITVIPLEQLHTIRRWTNRYCLNKLDPNNLHRNRRQFSAGTLFIRNSPSSRLLVEHWLNWCLLDDYSCLVDRADEAEDEAFQEHRHDQSILSLVVYDLKEQGRLALKTIDVATLNYRQFPILGRRNKSPFSAQGNQLRFRILGKLYALWVRLFWNEERYRRRLAASIGSAEPK